jgi:hypothetical protein
MTTFFMPAKSKANPQDAVDSLVNKIERLIEISTRLDVKFDPKNGLPGGDLKQCLTAIGGEAIEQLFLKPEQTHSLEQVSDKKTS